MPIYRVSASSVFFLLVGLILPYRLAFSQDTGPELQALSFAPRSIDTSAGPAKVMVNFRAAGRDSPAKHFEIGFASPSTVNAYKANATFAPAASHTGSVSVNFPHLSEAGTWTISFVLLADEDGYTRSLSTSDLEGRGFPTTLQVTSRTDETPPKLTLFKFTPDTIDITAGPADVAVSLEATDNLSGIKGLEISFVSPSGISTRQASTIFARPSASFTGTLPVNFPQSSEAGAWRVVAVTLADAAGNTSVLSTDDLTARGFPAALQVKKSAEDTTAPTLTAFSVSPSSLRAGSGPVVVRVDFTAADDISGVNAVQVSFVSPSGAVTRSASADFRPATSFTGSAAVQFPPFSEAGDWKIAIVLLADAVGNTRVLNAEDLREKGFPSHLTIMAEAAAEPSTSVMQATVFLGVKSGEDFATSFDLRAELYRNGVLAAAGQTLCITTLASNPEAAKKVSLDLEAVTGAPLTASGALSLRMLARIGTNPDGTKCSGPSKSTGLHLYSGTADWPSHVTLGASLDPRATLFLHAASGRNLLAPASPAATTAALSESGSLDFDEGNPWKEIGTWVAAR